MLSALRRAGRSLTAGLSHLSTPDSILMSYQKLSRHRGRRELSPAELFGFLAPFGDMTLWNILASRVVLPYISPSLYMANLMLGGCRRGQLSCHRGTMVYVNQIYQATIPGVSD